jgi:hypothetical protein
MRSASASPVRMILWQIVKLNGLPLGRNPVSFAKLAFAWKDFSPAYPAGRSRFGFALASH